MPTLTRTHFRLLILLGLLIVGCGGIVFYFQMEILKFLLHMKLNLGPNSELFPKWVKQENMITASFYVFNVTNPEEAANGAVVELEEIGPYVFR